MDHPTEVRSSDFSRKSVQDSRAALQFGDRPQRRRTRQPLFGKR